MIYRHPNRLCRWFRRHMRRRYRRQIVNIRTGEVRR